MEQLRELAPFMEQQYEQQQFLGQSSLFWIQYKNRMKANERRDAVTLWESSELGYVHPGKE